MVKYNFLYTSSINKNERSCNSYAMLKGGIFVKLVYFVTQDIETFCICHNLLCVPHNLHNSLHIITSISSENRIIDVNGIETICVMIEVNDLQFIMPCPNLLKY